MFTSIDAWLGYFDAVNRRAMRDIGALPAAADGWTPATGDGENAWSINKLVGHMAGSRLYFASAYVGDGWISPRPPDISSRDRWLPALEASAQEVAARLRGTPADWLGRKVALIDTPGGTITGWKILMLMAEHDIHHRSQLDTYSGLNGWDVPDIYGRSAETILALQEGERAKHGVPGPANPL
jgi:uncharacterized damage-inducible protein DinB